MMIHVAFTKPRGYSPSTPQYHMNANEIRSAIQTGQSFTVSMKERQTAYRIAETLGVQAKCRKAGVNSYEVIIMGTPSREEAVTQTGQELASIQTSGKMLGEYLLFPPSMAHAVDETRRWRALGTSFDDFPFLRTGMHSIIIGDINSRNAARVVEAYHPLLFIPSAENDWHSWTLLTESGVPTGSLADILEVGLGICTLCDEAGMDAAPSILYLREQLELLKGHSNV